jgi:hypothetical protein
MTNLNEAAIGYCYTLKDLEELGGYRVVSRKAVINRSDEARAYDWLGRAKEARAKAAQMTEPDVKQIMLAIARAYEKIAKHIKRRNPS